MTDTKQCPHCGGEILSIARKCKHCRNWVNEEDAQLESSIRCPICDEELSVDSVVCSHCGEHIGDYLKVAYKTNNHPYEQDSMPQPVKKKRTNSWRIALLLIVVIGLVFYLLIVFLEGDPNENQLSKSSPLHSSAEIKSYHIEDRGDVISMVRVYKRFIPRSTEVGVLFRKYYIFLQYLEENHTNYSGYISAYKYLSMFDDVIEFDPESFMSLELDYSDIERIQAEVIKRHEDSYNSIPDDALEGYFKKSFLQCSNKFDEGFKAQIAYDYICLHWDYRDVDKLTELYSLFSDGDFYNYYQDWLTYTEWNKQNKD